MGNATQNTDAVLQLTLGKDGQIQFDAAGAGKVTLANVGTVVKRAQAASQRPDGRSSPVVISADKDVKYESVVQVMDQLQRNLGQGSNAR